MNKEVIIDIENPKDNDLISRQAVLEIAKQHTLTNDYLAIQNLPSVRPQEQTGHWIDLHRCWICSECNQETHIEHKFCPNCGAKMVEPQESEE